MIKLLLVLAYVVLLVPFIFTVVKAVSEKSGENKISPRRWVTSTVVWLGGWLGLSVFLWLTSVYSELLWFREVGYAERFWTVFRTEWLFFLGAGFGAFVGIVLAALATYYWLRSAKPGNQAKTWMAVIAVSCSVLFAFIFAFWAKANWQTVLFFRNSIATGMTDPIFGKDIGFYLFQLPFLKLASAMLLTFFFVILLQTIAFAAAAGSSRHKDRWGDTETSWDEKKGATAFRLVAPLIFLFVGGMLAVLAWQRYLGQFGYLNSPGGVVYGATYVDVYHKIPYNKILIWILGLGALFSFAGMFTPALKRKIHLSAVPIAVFVAAWFILMAIVPSLAQAWKVRPNELALERPFIQHSINFTRLAYGLDKFAEQEVSPAITKEELSQVRQEDILKERQTTQNIRLADWRALINTFKQGQLLRRYYEFPDVDIDRYTVNGEYRQVMLVSRELNQDFLDSNAKTWVNKRLKFTHGYGVVVVPVNEFEQGFPKMFVRDIPPVSEVKELQITRPEIYFGAITRVPVIVNTTEDEFDYPLDEKSNKMTRYQGSAGVALGPKWSLRRFALANRFDGLTFYLSDALGPDSRILFRRTLEERVKTIAPFLRYDQDPYKVIRKDGRLVYILDAYTVTSHFPYAKPFDRGVNYIRNSVKAVVDAYNGSVKFFVFDEEDPVLKVLKKTFPTLFLSKDQMPQDLLAHVRYPDDLLMIQARMYNVYHMTDPEVFYNREDVWEIAREKYYDAEQEVIPYFVIMGLQEGEKGEFISILPFTPKGTKEQPRHNMIGWVAARSDADRYGKVLVYRFPKHKLTPGPMQMESFIDQDTEMSSAFTLWGQKGSKVIRGHLLVIPINNLILYVEPIYLEAEVKGAAVPRLERIVVGLGENVAWGKTFQEALSNLFIKMGKGEIPASQTPSGTEISGDVVSLVSQALAHLDNYFTLMGQGKIREAAEELVKHRQILEQLRNITK